MQKSKPRQRLERAREGTTANVRDGPRRQQLRHGYPVPNGAQFRTADRSALSTRHWHPVGVEQRKESDMAKGEQKGNREVKKPKKQQIKTIAAAPSQKTAGWQPSFGSGKKK
jgi:hypothetical protein